MGEHFSTRGANKDNHHDFATHKQAQLDSAFHITLLFPISKNKTLFCVMHGKLRTTEKMTCLLCSKAVEEEASPASTELAAALAAAPASTPKMFFLFCRPQRTSRTATKEGYPPGAWSNMAASARLYCERPSRSGPWDLRAFE